MMNTFRKRQSPFLYPITVFCLSILWLIPAGCSRETVQITTPAYQVSHVPHISDIHFNPFYDSSLSAQLIEKEAEEWETIFKTSAIQGCGVAGKSATNYNLLVSSLASMAQTDPKPDFILFTGDFLAHEFGDIFEANSQPGDNPAYQQRLYNRQLFSLIDYNVFYLDLEAMSPPLPGWQKEYNFNDSYGQKTITAGSLFTIYQAMNTIEKTRKDYMLYYNVSRTSKPALTEANWKAYWCAIGYWTATGFANCRGTVQ